MKWKLITHSPLHHVYTVNRLSKLSLLKAKDVRSSFSLGLPDRPIHLPFFLPNFPTIVGTVHRIYLTNPILDSIEDFLFWVMMPPAETGHKPKILFLCLFGQVNHLSNSRGIYGYRLFENNERLFQLRILNAGVENLAGKLKSPHPLRNQSLFYKHQIQKK